MSKDIVTLSVPDALTAGDIVIDREKRQIRNVSIITAGEALGHGFQIDDVMLDQVAKWLTDTPKGFKVHLTHADPGLFGNGIDPIEVLLGRATGGSRADGKVKGDIQFGKYASRTPKGDLMNYLMDIAEEDPTSVGLSIVYERAQDEVLPEDPRDALPRGRVRRLLAVDFVGDPGANPAGLLSAGAGAPGGEKQGEDEMVQDKEPKDPAQKLETPPAPAPIDVEALKREAGAAALAAEKTRCDGIMALAREKKLDEGWARGLCDRGVSLAQARELAALVETMKPVHIDVGPDRNLASLADIRTGAGPIADAIALRAGLKVEKPHDRAREFRRPMVEMARHYLKCVGLTEADILSREEIWRLVSRPQRLRDAVGLQMVTGDFPLILANVAGKSLQAAYQLAVTKWPQFCSRGTVGDFKIQSSMALSSAPALQLVAEADEYHFGVFTERREQYQIAKYGRMAKFSRELFINDDLNAFSDVLPAMGRKAKYLEDDLAFAILTANANMADGVPLFNAAHGNVGTGVPSIASYDAAYVLFKRQTDLDGVSFIEADPRTMIVPVALRGLADQIRTSQYDPSGIGGALGASNTWRDRLITVDSPRLDTSSAVMWYWAADPAMVSTIKVAFLEEEQEPFLDTESDFDADCIKYKVRHQCVAKALDWRGLYRSTGV